jgi:hypothetical protein
MAKQLNKTQKDLNSKITENVKKWCHGQSLYICEHYLRHIRKKMTSSKSGTCPSHRASESFNTRRMLKPGLLFLALVITL